MYETRLNINNDYDILCIQLTSEHSKSLYACEPKLNLCYLCDYDNIILSVVMIMPQEDGLRT